MANDPAAKSAATRWGYAVWGAMGVVIAIPEIWAAVDSANVPWPTISGTIGHLEYRHDWVAIIVIGVIISAAYYALRYRADAADTPLFRTDTGRLKLGPRPREIVPWYIYFPIALVGVALGSWIAHRSDPHDKFAFGQWLYGLIALFWILIPSALAIPRRGGRDAPFTTLFETMHNLERRLPSLAVIVAVGLTILVFHLVL